jgi:outer membrane protein TolC
MKKQLYTLIFIVFTHELSAQVVFSDNQFYQLVSANHPLSKQANLKSQIGDKSILKAKGGFDPKVYNQIDQKYYNSSQYYNLIHAGLKVPTWYGIEVKTGFESYRGDYLNPQDKTPNGGLWYGGVAVNLGQGLMIDQRRSELFKAKIYQQSSLSEQKMQLNELIYESGYAYWNWFSAFYSKQVLLEAYDLSVDRFDAVKRSMELGDRSAIDTVEAIIQVQNRESLFRNYEAELTNSINKLSTFLWTEENVPLELDSRIVPLSFEVGYSLDLEKALLKIDIDSALNNHPYLQISNFKIKSLEIDARLKREMLKPQLNLQYNLLNEPINNNPLNSLSVNNYKWGLNFEMPIFLRKERGDLAIAELKVQDAEFTFQNNMAYIEFKIKSAAVDYKNALTQVEIYKRTVDDTKRLLDAEKQMFENGESSLFLINAREIAFIQAKLKLIEGIVKSQQTWIALRFAMANLV